MYMPEILQETVKGNTAHAVPKREGGVSLTRVWLVVSHIMRQSDFE